VSVPKNHERASHPGEAIADPYESGFAVGKGQRVIAAPGQAITVHRSEVKGTPFLVGNPLIVGGVEEVDDCGRTLAGMFLAAQENERYLALAATALAQANLAIEEPAAKYDILDLSPFYRDKKFRAQVMAHCTRRGPIGEFGEHGMWNRRRRRSQERIARQILRSLGLSQAEIAKPRCCLLNGHPIWKAVRKVRGETRMGTAARHRGLEAAIARYPETHLRVADIEHHLRYHHVQEPNASPLGKRNAWRVEKAIETLRPREKELLLYLAQVELVGIRQWVDIWGSGNRKASRQVAGRLLVRLTDRELLFQVKRPQRLADVTTRTAYCLAPLGRAVVERLRANLLEEWLTDEEANDGDGSSTPPLSLILTEAYRKEQLNIGHLPHNISMVEALSRLYSDANRRAEPLRATVRGVETAAKSSMRLENVYGTRQLHIGYKLPAHFSGDEIHVAKDATVETDGLCVLAVKSVGTGAGQAAGGGAGGGEALGEGSDRGKGATAGKSAPRVVGMWAGVRPQGDAAEETRPGEVVGPGYAIPVLFTTQHEQTRGTRGSLEMALSSLDAQGRRRDYQRIELIMRRFYQEERRVRWADALNAGRELPPILLAAHADVYEKGWEAEVWCLHVRDEEGKARRAPLWRAMLASAGSLSSLEVDLSLPLLYEYDSGSKPTKEVASQILAYVGLGLSGAPLRRLPDYLPGHPFPRACAVIRLDIEGAKGKQRQRQIFKQERKKLVANQEARRKQKRELLQEARARSEAREKERAKAKAGIS
jgi:hypothetical protein